MKKLLVIMALVMLGACAKSDGDLTLACYGRNIQAHKEGDLTAEDETRKYEFKNHATGNYQCEWSSKIILCSSIEEKDGTRIKKQLIYDQSNEVLTENVAAKQVDKHISEKSLGLETFFIGKCQKPIIG